MKRWIFSFRVEPPNHTVLAKSGGSGFDAYYDRLLEQWYLVAGSHMEKIEQPQMLFLDDEYAREHERDLAPPPKKSLRRSKKPVQMTLDLS
jgi:hypothetical protein